MLKYILLSLVLISLVLIGLNSYNLSEAKELESSEVIQLTDNISKIRVNATTVCYILYNPTEYSNTPALSCVKDK